MCMPTIPQYNVPLRTDPRAIITYRNISPSLSPSAYYTMHGTSSQARASGKQSAPFPPDAVIPAQGTITIWMAPAGDPTAPTDDDKYNLLWRNKMGKPRRLPVLSSGGDAVELVNDVGAPVHFFRVLSEQ
eukprot:m.93891 g.93891  ORF g.93891 m.93891 type:complete len:130 (-) comp10023_c0_seq5:145-534(-)